MQVPEHPTVGAGPDARRGWRALAADPPRWLLLALLTAALAALYAPALLGEPLNWDDPHYIEDPARELPFAEALRASFTEPVNRGWYPLLRMSWWLQAQVSGDAIWQYQAVHVGLFLLSALLLFRVLERAGLEWRIALLATALWALHPLRVESVAWLSSRKDVLSLVLALLAAILLVDARKPPSARRIALGTAVFAGAVLAKTMVAPVAGVLALWHGGRFGLRTAVRAGGPLLVVATATSLAGYGAFQAGDGTRTWPYPELLDNVALGIGTHALLLGRLLWPRHLAAVYPLPEDPVPVGVAGLLLLLAGAGGAVALARRGRWEAPVLYATWLLPLVPLSGLVPLAQWAPDRYALIPSIAVAVVVAWGLAALARRAALAGPALAGPALLFLVLVPLGWRSGARIPAWRDPVALWEADVAAPGDHSVRRLNLGGAYGGRGRFPEAVEQLRIGETLAPDNANIIGNRLLAELVVRGWNERQATAGAFLRPPPTTAGGWVEVTLALAKAEEWDLALDAADFAERQGVVHEELILARVLALKNLGRIEEAREAAEALRPFFEARQRAGG